MHRNKGALNAEQSEFLKVLEQFNIDSIAIIEHEGEYNADEIEHRLATLRVILEYIKNYFGNSFLLLFCLCVIHTK